MLVGPRLPAADRLLFSDGATAATSHRRRRVDTAQRTGSFSRRALAGRPGLPRLPGAVGFSCENRPLTSSPRASPRSWTFRRRSVITSPSGFARYGWHKLAAGKRAASPARSLLVRAGPTRTLLRARYKATVAGPAHSAAARSTCSRSTSTITASGRADLAGDSICALGGPEMKGRRLVLLTRASALERRLSRRASARALCAAGQREGIDCCLYRTRTTCSL